MRQRLAAQLLDRPPGFEVGDIVRHLLAVQAQDVPSAQLAFRARSATVTAVDVEAAVERREIVRAWGPRGTLHYIHHDDLPWLLSLTTRRTTTLRRLAEEGVTGDDLLQLIDRAMAGQGPLTKAELESRLKGRAHGQGIVHLVGLAASHGLAVLGPLREGKPTYVHTADWLGAPVTFEPDRGRALTELGLRYRASHALASPEDLAAWSGLALGAATTAWSSNQAGAEEGGGSSRGVGSPEGAGTSRESGSSRVAVSRREVGAVGGAGSSRVGGPLAQSRPLAHSRPLRQAGPPHEDGAAVPVRLLPAFDEYLLGWRSRDSILAPEHARKVFPGGGILRAVVLVDGVIQGTWTRSGEVAPFGPIPDLTEELADVRRFLD